ncbi:hypothetical protein BABINDRAFT_165409 [Babjeviella inositovora NRRL Y-12698]|uniref:Activator of Hsp90 ATPase AHSA1-like N-terminal domain-containing protein n=1 Tax=Babjeviella inositovora NRRL Y-12698 TaxID=984486 RepID=A0A1E3QXV1_9ASCO|nr:uncharacterized protein BABINDRAFT_165409 [Babjeviella inositovora NRRL Y-12698]ODQ81892.1 hypothetical protein BABINDRAFT_165409 [Babjeviella inositovora NRRL Y-12698]
MVVHNPNNWHWVEKNCLPWSKEYLQQNVLNTEFVNDSLKIVVHNIDSVTGDCDVTQRKGKVLCIYDMKVEFAITSTVQEGEDETRDIIGTVILPEFTHDQDDDEYEFQVKADNSVDVKKYLLPVLLAKLKKFQSDLISTHEGDVQHATD